MKLIKHQTESYNMVLEWIFQNTNDLQNKKTEEKDNDWYRVRASVRVKKKTEIV